jgi:hypothetical protein
MTGISTEFRALSGMLPCRSRRANANDSRVPEKQARAIAVMNPGQLYATLRIENPFVSAG